MKEQTMRALVAGLLLSACAFQPDAYDPSQDRPDPSGTWRVEMAWGAGNCGQDGNEPIARGVVPDAFGNLIDESTGRPGYQLTGAPADGRSISGYVTCGTGLCRLAFVEDRMQPTANTRFQGQWLMDGDTQTITGTASVAVTLADGSCTQNATVAGVVE